MVKRLAHYRVVMATPFDLTLDDEALALVRRKGGTAALDFIPPIS